MNAVYLIDGEPHRVCDCDPMSQTCGRIPGHKRTMQTTGFAKCVVPAPETIVTSAIPQATRCPACGYLNEPESL